MKFNRRELQLLFKSIKIVESGETLLGLDVDRNAVNAIIEKIGREIDEIPKKEIEREIQELVEEAKEFELDFGRPRENFDALFGPSYPYSDTLKLLEKTIDEGKAVEIEYYTASRGEFTKRKIRPKSIERRDGTPYLNAYCYLRSDDRIFKLNRIRNIKLVEE